VPRSWPDGEPAGDPDDDGVDDDRLLPPVHPDDRLWRHPSELAWLTAPGAAGPAADPPPSISSPAVGRGGRSWGVAMASGVLGASLAFGAIMLLGGLSTRPTERVVERVGVRDQVPDPLSGREGPGLPTIVASVHPSVVRIESAGPGGTTTGAGVVLLDDGHIVTNAHVVAGAETVTILRADGTTVAGDVLGADAELDLAVIAARGTDTGWVPAVRGSAGQLQVGDAAVLVLPTAAGSPTAAVGVVAALERWVDAGDGTSRHGMVQTDLTIGAEGSGGAVCDATGMVVGIATAAGSGDGRGFATPIEVAWSAAESIMADGEVHHVWLGVQGADLDATRSSLLGIDSPGGGVAVLQVAAEGPAAAAGIGEGDVLVAVDGERLTSMSQLVVALRAHRPGDVVELTVVGGGATRTVAVTLGERD
jgi:putative serine protease PepD